MQTDQKTYYLPALIKLLHSDLRTERALIKRGRKTDPNYLPGEYYKHHLIRELKAARIKLRGN